MVLSEREDRSMSSFGSAGIGGGGMFALNLEVVAWEVEGRAVGGEAVCFDELGTASDEEGRLSSLANGLDLSILKSNENSDRCVFWLGLGTPSEGTFRSALGLDSSGGVPGNIGSAHTKSGPDIGMNICDVRSDLRPRGSVKARCVYVELSIAKPSDLSDLTSSKEFDGVGRLGSGEPTLL